MESYNGAMASLESRVMVSRAEIRGLEDGAAGGGDRGIGAGREERTGRARLNEGRTKWLSYTGATGGCEVRGARGGVLRRAGSPA